MISISSSIEISGSSIVAIIALQTSVKLCGAIDVAIPTAIPFVPFNRIFGSLAGRYIGSEVLLSKLG